MFGQPLRGGSLSSPPSRRPGFQRGSDEPKQWRSWGWGWGAHEREALPQASVCHPPGPRQPRSGAARKRPQSALLAGRPEERAHRRSKGQTRRLYRTWLRSWRAWGAAPATRARLCRGCGGRVLYFCCSSGDLSKGET
jgi:hypothetical protein